MLDLNAILEHFWVFEALLALNTVNFWLLDLSIILLNKGLYYISLCKFIRYIFKTKLIKFENILFWMLSLLIILSQNFLS